MHDHHQPLPFIKGVKNKQGIVLAEHSDPLLPIPMNGIAGLDMALACKADKVAFVTKLTVEDEVIAFTGLDHIKDSFACLIKIKSGGDWLGAIFATKTIDGDCTQYIQTLTDYYIRTYADGEWGEWAKHTIGEGGGIELPIAISDVTGLQAALDGKADSAHTQPASTITDFSDSVNGLTKKVFVVNDATEPISITLVDGDIETLTTPGAWRADLTYSGFSANKGGGIFIVRRTATGEITQMERTFQTLITDQYIYSRQLMPIIGLWTKTLLAGANQLEIADINGLQVALNGKSAVGHEHQISEVSGLQNALNGKADENHTHTKSQITDFSHTHSIANVDGLQSALDGKPSFGQVVTPSGLESALTQYQTKEDENLQTISKTIVGAINEVRSTHETVIEVDAGDGLELTDQTPFGQMYHIDNSMLAAQINQIITTQEGGNNIYYHQNAGSMIADHFMIRVYRYENEYFVEIAGAWNNIVPPQA